MDEPRDPKKMATKKVPKKSIAEQFRELALKHLKDNNQETYDHRENKNDSYTMHCNDWSGD